MIVLVHSTLLICQNPGGGWQASNPDLTVDSVEFSETTVKCKLLLHESIVPVKKCIMSNELTDIHGLKSVVHST